MTRWCGAGLGVLLLALTVFGAAAAAPKRVLILNSFGRDVPPFNAMVSSFRVTLTRDLGQSVDLYEMPLDMARFVDTGLEEHFVDFLEHGFSDKPVDLVVPVGAPAAQFALKYRQRLFSKTPILFAGASQRLLPSDALRTNATLVTQKIDLPGMIEDILQLQPDTTNIVVVFGASPLEKFWVGECRREWQMFTNRVSFTWLDNLSLPQMRERIQHLPPRSFIFFGMMLLDVEQVPYEGNKALKTIHAAANAPVFGCFGSQFGQGTIGGRLYQENWVGSRAAKVAERILRGESAGDIPPEVAGAAAPTYDWRELNRWRIRPERLAAGSVIAFREPNFWEQYRWRIAGGLVFCGLQMALIIGLLINRAHRRQGEAEATLIADITTRFVNVAPGELDREIVAAQQRICEFVGLDLSKLWQWPVNLPGSLTLTHHYRAKAGPPIPERMSAAEHFPWSHQQLLAGHIVKLSSLTALPVEAARELKNRRQLGIKSVLAFPLSMGGGVPFGALAFDTTRTERDWPDALVKRLQLVAHIFANALGRQRADQTLRESKERLSLAADSAEAGLWELDCRTMAIWATEKARAILEYPPEKVINLASIEASVHPADLNLVRRSFERAVLLGNPVNVEYRIQLGDGRTRWISSRGRLHFTSTGEPDRIMGVCTDITERRRTEDRVRQLSHAMEQSPVLVVITDLQGQITYVNRKFSEVTGYAYEECLGQNPRILKSGESPPSTYEELWMCITGGETWRGEFHNRKKNGELYWEWAVISPLRDAAGRITHFVGVKEDITTRKQTEGVMRDLSRRLIRAHEAERARLARELHDDVTQRLARLAIDAGRLEHGTAGVPVAETMRSVREGLVSLSEDVHALSYRLHPSMLEDLGLAEALKAECERFSRQESIPAVVTLPELPAELPPEAALCLFRVTQEALRNVARHAQARRVEVSVQARDGGLQLAVLDDGIGFEPDLQRARPSLGLASMRERVLLLGGGLDIESAPGKGTAILVSVPLTDGKS